MGRSPVWKPTENRGCETGGGQRRTRECYSDGNGLFRVLRNLDSDSPAHIGYFTSCPSQ